MELEPLATRKQSLQESKGAVFKMPEDDFYGDDDRSSSAVLLLLSGLAVVLAFAALAWIFLLQTRLSTAEGLLVEEQKHTNMLLADQAQTGRDLRAATDTLGAKLGITQKQIEQRAQDLLHQQQLAMSRLSKQQAEIRKQVGSVSETVSSVQSDVGGVKQGLATNVQDVASTRKELANTEQQLHAAVGDLGLQSGLIAKNGQELEYLKHLGDRNYFQFTLQKGKRPVAVSTVKLQLRKADVKHARCTLEIVSNDKRLEKKNRQTDEPLQFYSGKQPMLFEIVILQIEKNQVSGYLSTPKNAPQAITF